MSEISFEAACGAAELTANAYLVQAHGVRLLLDAGARQNRAPAWLDALEAPDACWLSHAHWDHLGALGPLKARWPRLTCLATSQTRRLARHALALGGLDGDRASALASQLQSVPERQYFELSTYADNPAAQKFRAMVFEAGHIPGAGMLLVEVDVGQERPFRILYTSDFCGHDQPGVPGALFPRTGQAFPIDVMVMEGVLATRKEYDEVSYADEWARFQQWTANRTGGALVAVSTLGEAAQVVSGLVEAGERPVVHRMLEPVVGKLVDKQSVEFGDETHARRALGLGKVVVAPGEGLQRSTPAGRLADAAGAVAVLNRKPRRKAAAPSERFLLGNHAPRGQLVGAVNAVNPSKVILVHGHKSQLFSLKRAIEKSGYAGEVLIPKTGETVPLSS
ncbi:MBL fold metallo-hydrolase [Persicimonas caeni]|nr:MBL fold metallo-hydrolase [Persicimonas caeni]